METGLRIEGDGVEGFQQEVENFAAEWVDRSGDLFDRAEANERAPDAMAIDFFMEDGGHAARIVLSFGPGPGTRRGEGTESHIDLLDEGPLQIEVSEGRFSVSADALEARLREMEERAENEAGSPRPEAE